MKQTETLERSKEYERMVFFSDAVFAIAITLLVIDIRLPAGLEITSNQALNQALLTALPGVFSYLISFFVIGSFWLAHHTLFTYVARIDTRLIWLNFLFLFFVAITPFPTRIVGEYGAFITAKVLYASDVVLMGLTKLILWLYVTRAQGLLVPGTTDAMIRHHTWRSLVIPGIFLVSIPIAFTRTGISYLLWAFGPPGYFFLDRIFSRMAYKNQL